MPVNALFICTARMTQAGRHTVILCTGEDAELSWALPDLALEADDEARIMSPHTALGMAATPSGRLAFAHPVMPMISDIGRELAARYAVVFESGALRTAQLEASEKNKSS